MSIRYAISRAMDEYRTEVKAALDNFAHEYGFAQIEINALYATLQGPLERLDNAAGEAEEFIDLVHDQNVDLSEERNDLVQDIGRMEEILASEMVPESDGNRDWEQNYLPDWANDPLAA